MMGPGRNLSHHQLFSCYVLALTLKRARVRNRMTQLPGSGLGEQLELLSSGQWHNSLTHLSLPLEGTGPNRRREEEGNGKNKGFSGHSTKLLGFPGGSVIKNPPANTGYMGLIPDLGRSHMPWSNQAREPQQEKPQR